MDDSIDWNDPILQQYSSPHKSAPASNSINTYSNNNNTNNTNSNVNTYKPANNNNTFKYVPPTNIYRPPSSSNRTAGISNTTTQSSNTYTNKYKPTNTVTQYKPTPPATNVSNNSTTNNTSNYDIPDSFFEQIVIPTPTTNSTVNKLNAYAYKPTTANNTTVNNTFNSTTNNTSPNHPYNAINTTLPINTINPFAKPTTTTQPLLSSITQQNFLTPALTKQQHDVNQITASSAPRIPMCRKHHIAMHTATVKKQTPNYGRKFWSCSLPQEDRCKEFVWDNDKYVFNGTCCQCAFITHCTDTLFELYRVELNKLPWTTAEAKPQLTISLELVAPNKISLNAVPYDPILYNQLRQQCSGTNAPNIKGLVFELTQQTDLVNAINAYANKVNVKVRCNTIDDNVIKLLNADRKQHISLLNTMSVDHTDDLIDLTTEVICNPDDLFNSESPIKQSNNTIKKRKRAKKPRAALTHTYDIEPLFDVTRIPTELWNKLLPFQQDGVKYAVNQLGRCHISDDMGLGKTIQAVTIAYYYRTDWPLLIVCPSSVRLNWCSELIEWLVEFIPDKQQCISEDDINIIMSGKDELTNDKPITIISYDLAAKMSDQLQQFEYGMIILDESHYIKSSTAKRTQHLVPIVKSAKRALLLSGTPALNRPSELYTQIDCLIPGLLPKYTKFGMRYCDGKEGRFGFEYKGGTHLFELYSLLTKHVLIRREKSAVLTQLPAKRRQQILIDVPQAVSLKKKLLKSKSDTHNIEKLLAMAINNDSPDDALNITQSTLFALFKESGKMKLPGICDYIDVLIESEIKFLIFAHHLDVLDGIEECVQRAKVDYMRIDGSTKPEIRQFNVNKFQTEDTCKVAILSIQAAGTGITLHAASTVIFAELVWSPKILEQAEDRIHRIGQYNTCNIHYLIGRGTCDDMVWPMIKKKFDILGNALSESYQANQKNAFDMNTVDRPADRDQKQLHYFPDSAKGSSISSAATVSSQPSTASNNVTNSSNVTDSNNHGTNTNSTNSLQLPVNVNTDPIPTTQTSMPPLEPDDDTPIAQKYGSHVIPILSDNDSEDDVPICKKVKLEPLTQSHNHNTKLIPDYVEMLDDD